MPYYNDGDLHDKVVVRFARLLLERHPDHRIEPNVKYKHRRHGPPLKNGLTYYPDVADYTAKIAYEVHWKGDRKKSPLTASLKAGRASTCSSTTQIVHSASW